MKLRDEILKEHSKAQATKIVSYVGEDQNRFDQLVDLFLHDEYRVVQRAGWPLSTITIAHPKLVKKHLKKIVSYCTKEGLHGAVKRNIVRLLQFVTIPKSMQGEVMDTCFRFVESPDEAVAVKAFSLTVLCNLAKDHPEIIPEIKMLIEDQLPHQTAAFASRASKVLREMEGDKAKVSRQKKL
ncbi:hypothetical protein [Pollutibacter soli]|uniref:hypothetical protein n=1 Tax=Pollutibacter soli TaxID=3034157 RepID=UPI0030137316